MLALTIRQPWAAMIAAADPALNMVHVKAWEMRGQRPDREHAGETFLGGDLFAVHAGRTTCLQGTLLLKRLGLYPQELPAQHANVLGARGAVVAVARAVGEHLLYSSQRCVRGCVSAALDARQVRIALPFVNSHMWGWEFADVQLLTHPVECTGMPGVFQLDPGIAEAVRAAIPG